MFSTEVLEHAWNDEKWMLYWADNVWKKHAFFKCKTDTMLVMDAMTAHLTEDVTNRLKQIKTHLSIIPCGMTRKLQPLDVSINKPVKDYLRKCYVNHLYISHNEKVKKNQIIKWINDIWWDENIITKEMVRNSFLFTGISNRLDGSEDHLFKGYDDLEEDNFDIELELEENLSDYDSV